MGFPEVFVLDGGLRKWRAEGRAVESTVNTFSASCLTSRFQPGLICAEYVSSRLASKSRIGPATPVSCTVSRSNARMPFEKRE